MSVFPFRAAHRQRSRVWQPLAACPRSPHAPLHVDLFPSCAAHVDMRPERLALAGLPPPQCLGAASAAAQSPGGWSLVPVGPLVTALRECDTLSRVGDAVGGSGTGSGAGCLRGELLDALLRPDEASSAAGGRLARLWPSDMGRPEYAPFFNHLKATYDMPQVDTGIG